MFGLRAKSWEDWFHGHYNRSISALSPEFLDDAAGAGGAALRASPPYVTSSFAPASGAEDLNACIPGTANGYCTPDAAEAASFFSPWKNFSGACRIVPIAVNGLE